MDGMDIVDGLKMQWRGVKKTKKEHYFEISQDIEKGEVDWTNGLLTSVFGGTVEEEKEEAPG